MEVMLNAVTSADVKLLDVHPFVSVTVTILEHRVFVHFLVEGGVGGRGLLGLEPRSTEGTTGPSVRATGECGNSLVSQATVVTPICHPRGQKLGPHESLWVPVLEPRRSRKGLSVREKAIRGH